MKLGRRVNRWRGGIAGLTMVGGGRRRGPPYPRLLVRVSTSRRTELEPRPEVVDRSIRGLGPLDTVGHLNVVVESFERRRGRGGGRGRGGRRRVRGGHVGRGAGRGAGRGTGRGAGREAGAGRGSRPAAARLPLRLTAVLAVGVSRGRGDARDTVAGARARNIAPVAAASTAAARLPLRLTAVLAVRTSGGRGE